MNRLRNEEGVILITVLLLMAVVALLGVVAINTSTVDIQISGNMRRVSEAFSGAEAGTDVVVPVIERTIAAGDLDPTSIAGRDIDTEPLSGVSLATEIAGGSNYHIDTASENPDVTLGLDMELDINKDGNSVVEVNVDIDRMYSYTLPGGAMEFASGYEGVGAAAAGGGIGVLYRVTSQGTR